MSTKRPCPTTEKTETSTEDWTGEQFKRMKSANVFGFALEFLRRMPLDANTQQTGHETRETRLEQKLETVIMDEVKTFNEDEKAKWENQIRVYCDGPCVEKDLPLRMTYFDCVDKDGKPMRNIQWRGKWSYGFSFGNVVFARFGEAPSKGPQDLHEMQVLTLDEVCKDGDWVEESSFHTHSDRFAYCQAAEDTLDQFSQAQASQELEYVHFYAFKVDCTCMRNDGVHLLAKYDAVVAETPTPIVAEAPISDSVSLLSDADTEVDEQDFADVAQETENDCEVSKIMSNPIKK